MSTTTTITHPDGTTVVTKTVGPAGAAASAAGAILGMGNPLLDISAHVPDEMVTKYEVKKGEAVLAEEKHMPVYAELVKDYPVQYVAGGATLNSIRVAKWMMQQEGSAAYMGCISTDEFGCTMEASLAREGVAGHFKKDAETPTGTCAVLVTPDGERTLIANLSAANKYSIDHFQEAPQQAALAAANVVYSAGFFLTVCADAMVEAAEKCKETGAKYCMNLSAPFLMQVPFLKGQMDRVLPLCDFVFGNETEAKTFSEVMEWGTTDIKEIAAKLQALPGKEGKTVVITQGSEPTVVAEAGGVREFSVIQLSKAELVDTNGAGDAFVGGFLSGVARQQSIAQSVEHGNFAANVVIQRSGCTFPKHAPTQNRALCHPDQPARFAQQKAEGDKQAIDIDSVYEPELLKGKVCLVTGGNRGLGLAIVLELVRIGAKVVATCRKTSDELSAAGVMAIVEGCEMTDDAAVKKMAGEVPLLDVVINNAGYFKEHRESILEGTMDFADQMKTIDICSVGPLRVTSYLYSAGKLKQGCKVAFITSQGGSIEWRDVQCPSGGDYGHHMSKAAANMAGKLVANELRGKVAVGILHPGFNRTQMTAKYSHIWDIEGAVDSAIGAKRVCHEITKITMCNTGSFVNCENGKLILW